MEQKNPIHEIKKCISGDGSGSGSGGSSAYGDGCGNGDRMKK